MLEEILGNLDYHDTEGVELSYHLYQSACKGNLSISEILEEHKREEEKVVQTEEVYEPYFQEEETNFEVSKEEEYVKNKEKKPGF